MPFKICLRLCPCGILVHDKLGPIFVPVLTNDRHEASFELGQLL